MRKRIRDAHVDEEIAVEDAEAVPAVADMDDGFRRKVINVICAVIAIYSIFLSIQEKDPLQPIFVSPTIIDLSVMDQSDEYDDETLFLSPN